MKPWRIAIAAALALGACAAPTATTAPSARSASVDARAAPVATWPHGAMISAANPLAVEAGLAILRKGGSAVDAAIAVQAALSLVEPQSSGIGGGAFLVHFDAKTGKVETYDGREVAPQGATPDMFLGEDGKPLPFAQAIVAGRSTGVPGVMAMLDLAHRDHGRLRWDQLFDPAIALAEDGFRVSPRMAGMIAQAERFIPLRESPDARAYLFLPNGDPLPAGHLLVNRPYAQTLRTIAREGAKAMYEGPIAEAIVARVQQGPRPGTLSLADLAAYRPRKLDPICGDYRAYRICGMRPPSSGGVAILSILGTLENLPIRENGPTTARGWHYLIEAQRLGYADRDLYVADDRFVEVPLDGLIDRAYLKSRAALVQPDRAMARVEAGAPPGAPVRGRDATGEVPGTSHFVVVDARGNVVSMTTTVESIFGSHRMVGGFFLNNQLTDFSFRPVDDQGRPVANAVGPGKRPRSSMSPTIVFDRDGGFLLAVGSPGGNAIIAYVVKALVGVLDWGLSPQEALNLPNVIARRQVVAERTLDPKIREELGAMGHAFSSGMGGEGSGLHAVMRTPGGLVGAADTRREGVARAP
jgi:gamma-glutamyltranspeptidase/glutathione hydrolase